MFFVPPMPPKALNPCGIGAQLSPTLQGGTMVVALVNGGPSQVSQKTVCRCWLRCPFIVVC